MSLYDQLLPRIVKEFSIQAAENISILRQMSSGFSGAEVYEVELKHPSKYTGKYFLKIDRKDEEFCNRDVAKTFSHAATYVEAREVDAYYILLIGLAGNSGIEFKSFWASSPAVCKERIKHIVEDRLNESLDRKSFSPAPMPLSKICDKMLGGKIADGGTIDTFLKSRLAEPVNCNIRFLDELFPNPLYFARKPVDLRDCFYLKARVHGDLHGENIFLAQHENDYAIIDWALARDDGILFFDNAYFELSLLMQIYDGRSLHNWIEMVENICGQNWDDLDFEKAGVIQLLHMQEDFWVKTVNSPQFSHLDKMKMGQYIARVAAGLNFAGKKGISDAKREYAFTFSCIYLKKLLVEAKDQRWTELPSVSWNQTLPGGMPDMDRVMELADYCSHFSGVYQYILICGSALPQQELENEYLARIPWRGVLSLSTQDSEPLKSKIKEGKYLRHLTFTQRSMETENVIQNSDAWWSFVNGYASSPDSMVNSFAEWRNRYRNQLERYISKICSAAPPQELMLIVSYDSLASQEERKKVQVLLECFDAGQSDNISVAALNPTPQPPIDTDDFENLNPQTFDADLAALANYASVYLHGRRKEGISLPQQGKQAGTQLSEDDERYISSFLEIVGDHLLNPGASDHDVKSFYWGEPITWDAIDRQLPVYLSKTEVLVKDIRKRIEEEKWGRIELSHLPGAGASVLVREVCWQLRKEYPVVRVKQIADGMFESLKRIAKQTSLPILILLDGDYSRGDVETIETHMSSDLTNRKYILLYTYRTYRTMETPKLNILGVREAENFERQYVDIMEKHQTYTPDEIDRRRGELQQLTRTQALAEFRLPFFYGMYTFHEDFASVTQYIDKIVEKMRMDSKYCKIVSYLSIVTYFTSSFGLSHKITKKLLGKPTASLKKILDFLNYGNPAFVYERDAAYRICHPVIAFRILQSIYGNPTGSLATPGFSKVCREFITDIRRLDSKDTPSDYADRLVTTIFIKRSQVDRADDTQRNTFSTIVLMLENSNLQAEVLQCLTEQFSQNPHCFQHYGRLLSSHAPRDIDTAKQQFDHAIQLDKNNPIHYHARGIMYMRYCRNLINSKELKTPGMVLDQCKTQVECAIQDFETAIELARGYPIREDSQFNLVYPYSSILDVCTMIVTYMKRCHKTGHDQFWRGESNPIRWCHELLATAKRYDMNVDQDYPDVDRNSHYTQSRKELSEIEFSQSDIRALVQQNPEDVHFKILYLSNLDTRRDTLSSMKAEDLDVALNYCETVIQSKGGDSGLLWKWFQIYSHMPSFNEAHALGLLESVQTLDSSITANYLLQLLYFCRFYRTRDRQDAEKSRSYQKKCRELCRTVSGAHRRSCPFFLSDSKSLPLTDSREKGIKLDCTLTEDVVQAQSAHMTLNLYPGFSVVFIPHYNKNLKIGQELGTVVKATIGFGYNGLYGFDLELQQADHQQELPNL